MKTLDIDTVLAIIEMIENQIGDWTNDLAHNKVPADIFTGAKTSLLVLQEHLQSYIEGQLNALENRTEQ